MRSAECQQQAKRAKAEADGRSMRPYKARSASPEDGVIRRREWKREYSHRQRQIAAEKEGRLLIRQKKNRALLDDAHVAVFLLLRPNKEKPHDAHIKVWAVRSNKVAAKVIKRLSYEQKEQLLNAAQLRELVSYNPETGVFHWLVISGRTVPGGIAGNTNSNGYGVIGLRGEKFRKNRLAWLYVHGCWPTGTIDHIDTDKRNNRIANLRDVSQAINKQNMRSPTAANTSGFLGVYWSKRRNGFMASISINRKQKRRGPYSTAERAYSAYVDLKRRHHEGCTL